MSRGMRKYSTVRASAKLLGGITQESPLRSTKLCVVEVLGIDQRVVDIGEDPELGRHARVVAVGGQPVGDHPLAGLPVDERLDHAVRLRHLADPPIRHDRHRAAPLARRVAPL